MASHTVLFSKTFKQELVKLSPIDQNRVLDKIEFLKSSPHHPSLRTKKLYGKPIRYESSVSMSIRLIWRYQENKIILMLDVGHHDVLRKY
ncbi:MAG: hypothetical protein LBH93_08120 [Chitinispirillales bacterium]|nr:hypothetical protein [Chitinispirillales bacterium]